jgi:ATP-dependent HslUV protease ATP-binding subunit HslU
MNLLSNDDHSDAPPMKPSEIVSALDQHIVGQSDAKRAVAIAIRNRWRRQQLSEELRTEVSPKNIMMIGSTGVGKTEIARRLAKLTNAPFIKVEATKYTEVGYYGRDVESMVRELLDNAISLVRKLEKEKVKDKATQKTRDKLLDLLCPRPAATFPKSPLGHPGSTAEEIGTSPDAMDSTEDTEASYQRTRQKMGRMLDDGKLENRKVEIVIDQKSSPIMMGGMNVEQMDVDFQGMMEKIMPVNQIKREVSVDRARQILYEQQADGLLDDEKIHEQAIELAENYGIIFLDEIDKVVATEGKSADVSRQGVQRDLLPIVEGTTVKTKHGYIKTDHILFVAAGAFHKNQPSELMPELQGRFPIRVELDDLTKNDFVRILTEPTTSLTRQYTELLNTEGVTLEFSSDGIEALADVACRVNETTMNIGARRLYTILERLLEELSFAAPDMGKGNVVVNAAYVEQRLGDIVENEDLSRFIL